MALADILEKEIEGQLVKLVKAHGGLCLKWVCPGWKGVPDRIIILPGARICFVETKRPVGGRREKLQEVWAKRLTAFGFPHFWISNHAELQSFRIFLLEWAPQGGGGTSRKL